MTLTDVWEELERGDIYECSLRDPKWHLDGLHQEGRVYVDPRPAILETVIHELLHRRYPRMRERAVAENARRLLGGMDEQTKRRWFRAYNRIKRKARALNVEE